MSATIRASRSPLRRSVRPAGASGSIAAKNQTRRSARIAKRRAVGHVPLEVAERGPGDGQDADGGDREGDLGDVADEGGPRDQERRHRHQRDVRADRQEAEQRADAIQRRCAGEQPEQAPRASSRVGLRPRRAGVRRSRAIRRRRARRSSAGRAGLDEPARVEDRDDVGDRRQPQPVRHDERPSAVAARRSTASRSPPRSPGRGARWLVEDDQPRVGEERPGDREPLALAAAEPDPPSPTASSSRAAASAMNASAPASRAAAQRPRRRTRPAGPAGGCRRSCRGTGAARCGTHATAPATPRGRCRRAARRRRGSARRRARGTAGAGSASVDLPAPGRADERDQPPRRRDRQVESRRGPARSGPDR